MKHIRTFRVPACLALLLSCLAGAAPATAEIYRWTDPNGKVHYSERKPAKDAGGQVQSFRGEARVSFLGGGGNVSTESAAKVRMLMTQSCPYCKKAKAFLQSRGTAFEELDIEASAQAKAEYDRLGGKGVPIILVGEQRGDGFDPGEMERMLTEAGL